MNILITGGAGFIGSHLAEFYLNHSEHHIIVLDNFNDYYKPKKKQANIELLKNVDSDQQLTVVEGDIRNSELIKSIFTTHNLDQVIHLAAMAGVRYSIENPELYTDVNIKGTMNLLNACKDHNISSVIFASSSSVYGNCTETPFTETQSVDRPVSPYAATKKSGEEFCYMFHHLYDINVTCLRFFTVYGPRGRPDMAPYIFLHRVSQGIPIDRYGDGTSQRDYTYIADIVQGIVKAAEKDYPYEIFNLGRGQTIELNDFIATVEDVTGKEANINPMPMQPGDVPITFADISKAKRMLGYDPQWDVEAGLKKTYKWYQEV